jgi:uncharacterized protein YhaN
VKRLRAVEAVRYGELADAALGELGAGLSVVYGGNEAGKSTYTSLIRHVLYGFPRGRTNERLYQTPSGDRRVGRLVFTDEDGRWVVERTEGVRGGEAAVHGPMGEAPGDEFLAPIIRGISAGVYRSVFAFSLEELSDLGSLDDIHSRLHATATGLSVDPHDVLEKLRKGAEELWAPKARTKHIHNLNKELGSAREKRRKLAEVAESYRADREERAAIEIELEEAEEAVRTARPEGERLAALAAEGRRLEERIAEEGEAATEHRLEADRVRKMIDALEVDEDLLGRAEAVESLGARGELFRTQTEQLRGETERLREIERDVQRRVADMGEGWTVEIAEEFPLDLELENALHEAAEELGEANREREESQRRADEARSEHAEAARVASESSRAMGVAFDDPTEEEIGLRLATVDRLLAIGGESAGATPSMLPGLAAAVIAAVLVVAGFAFGDRLLALAGALPAALAVGLFVSWGLNRRRTPPDVASLLAVLDLERMPTAPQLLEIRTILDGCRTLWDTESRLARVAGAREAAAREAAREHERALARWLEWLDDRGLGAGSNRPESVQRVLRSLRDLQDKLEKKRDLEAQVGRLEKACRQFVVKAIEVGVVKDGAEETMDFEEVGPQLRSLVERLGAARGVEEKRRKLEAEATLAEERAGAAEARAKTSGDKLQEIFEKAQLEGGGVLAELEAAVEAAKRRTIEAEGVRDSLLETRGTLDGRLQRSADESESAELRLVEAGLVERLAESLESYAVKAVAASLLEDSLSAYEAERQPAVIRRAQEIFSTLTGGRYTRVATPLGKFEPSVTDGAAVGKPPDKLSRATAEQLFLALRLSYIENLADAHPSLPVLMDDVLVNFDDVRRRAAAEVIADFATSRQVVFFTCHPATVEAFANVAADHTRLNLG